MIPQIQRIIKQFINLFHGKEVLDVGCGVGRDTRFYLDQGFNVVGVDLSAKILKLANKAVSETNFCRMDMRYLGFANETFDAIHCWASLQHVPKHGADGVLSNFSRLLRKGGGLLIHTRYGQGENFIPEKIRPRRFFALYNEEELTDLVTRHGFAVATCEIVQKVRFEPGQKMISLYAKKK